MTLDLKDRLAVVTGAGGAMGRAAAQGLQDDGCRLALIDIDAAALDSLCAAMRGPCLPMVCDISDPAAVASACARIRSELGDPDILVNNAGILSNHKVLQTELAEWRHVLGVNLDGAYLLARELIPAMKARRWGRIINTGSLAAKTGGLTAGTAYAVSKGALTSLTFSLARELAPHGITANAISPAYVRTPMITEQLTEAQRQALLRDIPVGRFCEPQEFAHVVRFLASPLAGFITGEIVDLNGGLLMD
ncbi:MAG TPA: SDR family NAD(P)-dependent oxidoreductase [Albitalea sp.]|uniref:SDR family NAD(P)-dependent oxidoreductase n=1 Tax=Piscinibacter sp. TaxID=1903157 RepID=UPI002ECFC3C3